MQIAIYNDEWNLSGITTFCHELADALSVQGHDLTLILGRPHIKRDPVSRSEYLARKQQGRYRLISPGLPRFSGDELQKFAFDFLAQQKFEVLIANQFAAIIPALQKLSATRRIVSVGHCDHPYYYDEFRRFYRYCLHHVVVSTAMKQECLALAAESTEQRISVIPYGVSLPCETPVPSLNSELKVAFIGRFDNEQKRIADLPLIWRRFLEKGGKGTLTLFGGGKGETWLRSEFAQEIKSGTVNIAGRHSRAELLQKIPQFSVLLNVSQFEGLPLVLLESTVRGLYPVLSNIRSGHPDFVQATGGGTLCPVGDVEAFSEALLQLYREPEKLQRERITVQAASAKEYGIHRIARMYVDLLSRLEAEPTLAVPSPLGTLSEEETMVQKLRRRFSYWRHYRHTPH